MVNTNKLKAKLVEKHITQKDLALLVGVNTTTINRKLNDTTGESISIKEVTKLQKILELSNEEMRSIFFNNSLKDTQENSYLF